MASHIAASVLVALMCAYTCSGLSSFALAPRGLARVGSQIYHVNQPGQFYYAQGSRDAVPSELEPHRIGGEGRFQVFHFPVGAPAAAAKAAQRGRRSSISSLVQLKSGTALDTHFPAYKAAKTYKSPLSADNQKLEKSAGASITKEQVLADLTEITTFPTRSYNNYDASGKVEKYLQDKFEAMGLKTCLHNFNAGFPQQKLANVVAYHKGSGEGAVTVGAHYDSRPFSGAAPGADDNGSGVAAMLSIAKAYMSSKIKSTKSVYFVGFAGEEDGLDGSKAYTDALFGSGLPAECAGGGAAGTTSFLQDGDKTKVEAKSSHRAIILDEVGWRSPSYANATLNLESYDWATEVLDHVAAASATLNGDALKIEHSSNPFGSDHMSFLEKEIPAALMINADDEAYPNYHQSTDTIDNVDMEYVAQIGRASLGGLIRLAN